MLNELGNGSIEDDDFSFMAVDLDSARELSVLNDNTEVRLDISEAMPCAEKYYVKLTCVIVDEEFVDEICYFLNFPRPDDSKVRVEKTKRKLRSFYAACGLEETPKDPAELVGCTFNAILGVTESDEWGKQNKIKRLVNPS